MDPKKEMTRVKCQQCQGYKIEEILLSYNRLRTEDVIRDLKKKDKSIAHRWCVYIILRTEELAYGGLLDLDDFLDAVNDAYENYFSVRVYDYPDSEIKEFYATRLKTGSLYSLIFITKDNTSYKALLDRDLPVGLVAIKSRSR